MVKGLASLAALYQSEVFNMGQGVIALRCQMVMLPDLQKLVTGGSCIKIYNNCIFPCSHDGSLY
jgi:hypothetical protein